MIGIEAKKVKEQVRKRLLAVLAAQQREVDAAIDQELRKWEKSRRWCFWRGVLSRDEAWLRKRNNCPYPIPGERYDDTIERLRRIEGLANALPDKHPLYLFDDDFLALAFDPQSLQRSKS